MGGPGWTFDHGQTETGRSWGGTGVGELADDIKPGPSLPLPSTPPPHPLDTSQSARWGDESSGWLPPRPAPRSWHPDQVAFGAGVAERMSAKRRWSLQRLAVLAGQP